MINFTEIYSVLNEDIVLAQIDRGEITVEFKDGFRSVIKTNVEEEEYVRRVKERPGFMVDLYRQIKNIGDL